MKVAIRVVPRSGLADPQSENTLATLKKLGFENVEECSLGRYFLLDLQVKSKDEATALARSMCERLLCNPVLEDFSIEVVKA